MQTEKVRALTTVGALARLVAGEVLGEPETAVSGFSGIEDAGPGDITFAWGKRYRTMAEGIEVAAIVVDSPLPSARACQIVVDDANSAIAVIASELSDSGPGLPEGIHPSAVVDPSAQVHPSARLGPQVVVEAGAIVGAGSLLYPLCYVGPGAEIGQDCRLYPNTSVCAGVRIANRVILQPGVVVGADGFGYATSSAGEHLKIPQVGTVVIEDDVEVGANSCIDRARFAETRIGRGTKIDNLVQVGHNVEIGHGTLLVSQVGIAGSTKLGHHCVLGGHVGVKGHVTLGDGAQVGAYSGVGDDLPGGQAYLGIPARPIKNGLKIRALQNRLPDMLQRVRTLERRLAELEASIEAKGDQS